MTRVLLICDESIGMSGCAEIVHCTSVKEAADIINESKFDVIILDLCKGLEALRRVRKLTMDIPIVVLVEPGSNDVKTSLICGAQDYLVKGQFSPEAFMHCVLHAQTRLQAGLCMQSEMLTTVKERFRAIDNSLSVCPSLLRLSH